MKRLNITKEQFNKSNYFQKKYGKLRYVSESGKLFKTSKGKVLKFNEADDEYAKYRDEAMGFGYEEICDVIESYIREEFESGGWGDNLDDARDDIEEWIYDRCTEFRAMCDARDSYKFESTSKRAKRRVNEVRSPKTYTIIKYHRDRETPVTGTIPELVEYFGYTLLKGNSWNPRIPTNPKTINSLIKALNDSVAETQGSCYEQDYYELG